tara:strand:+ start:249 stop:629 length:381 start_codon:yes stop_codon:yes gene_type:complete
MSKKNNKEVPLNEDFKSVMESVGKMDSNQFAKTLEEERKKMLSLKRQYPNNPLFSQMDSEDFNISQDEFMDMCKLIMTGNMSETLSEAFNFIGGNEKNSNQNAEGCLPSDDSDDEEAIDTEDTPQG